jgi:hypothetical protein
MSDELLSLLVEADRAARPERPHFRVLRLGNRRGTAMIRHGKLESGFVRVPRADIEDLADRRLIRLRKQKSKEYGESWEFDLLDKAFELHKREGQRVQLARATPMASAEASPYDWNGNVLPVLRAVGAALSRLGADSAAATFGVSSDLVNDELNRPHEDGRTATALKALADGGYLKPEREFGSFGPEHGLPTEKGHQIISGWPSREPGMVYTRLLEVLDEQADAAEDEQEEKRWRDLRKRVADIGQSIVTDVLTRVVTGGLG